MRLIVSFLFLRNSSRLIFNRENRKCPPDVYIYIFLWIENIYCQILYVIFFVILSLQKGYHHDILYKFRISRKNQQDIQRKSKKVYRGYPRKVNRIFGGYFNCRILIYFGISLDILTISLGPSRDIYMTS